jgi:hypothetical protein
MTRDTKKSPAGRGTSLRIQGDPKAKGFYQRSGAIHIGELVSLSILGRMLPLFELPLN